ncbi:hypothetical protein HBA95_18500 [Ochrobactrum sp. MR31]|nr:hypothetical protein [Ochrobactrum sp. MR31]
MFGGKSKKQETTTTSHVDYGRMVREAEAAGFNPLTALRNGGAAGFSVSTGTTPATPLSARIADGVSGAAQTFLANFDPFKDQQRETEFKLVEAQLANLNADTALKQRTGLGSVPTYTGGNTKRTMGAGVGHNQKFKSVADVLLTSAGAPQTPTIEKPTVTNPYSVSSGLHVNPAVPDADAFETRYGDSEILSTINGALSWSADMFYNARRYYRDNQTYMRKEAVKPSPTGTSTTYKVLNDLWHGRKKPALSSPRKYKQ